ncbi:hypothetical protein BJV82DRAFT_673224 [Fennellomyces sp. T-0311]|nr:hypothetical protein BJV82DRAFT_673224 [Fennellomyces sp. T-0311]
MTNGKSEHIGQQCVSEAVNVVQALDNLNVHKASTETLSLHPAEPTLSASEVYQQHIFFQDFVHIFPAEITCAIFESIAFYDFVSCTNVSPSWRTFLMEFVWPQKQDYFLSLYPLFPLSQQERTKVVSWLQGHPFGRGYYPPTAFRRLKSQLEHNSYLQHRHEPEYVTYLPGKSYEVLLDIEEELQQSKHYCRQLKRLKLESKFIALPLTNLSKRPKLSITYLSRNRLPTPAHTNASPIDVLKDILLLCPFLRELILSDQNCWDGSIHRILQLCPSALSTITLQPCKSVSRQIVSYIPVPYVPYIQKLSIDLRYSHSDWSDIRDAIASVTEMLQILRVVFPNSGEPPTIAQRQNIIKMTEAFHRCYRLHTADIKCGSMTKEILKAVSELPSLECIHFSFQMDDKPEELLSFFTATNAQIQKIYLYNSYDMIDDNILSAISRFPSLQILKVTAFPFPEPIPKKPYTGSMIEQVLFRNPKLKVIHNNSVDGIHLVVQTTDV